MPRKASRAVGVPFTEIRWLLSCCGDSKRPGGLRLHDRGQFKAAGNVDGARQNEPVANVFARRSVVARGESVQRIADSIHIIKQFAQHASPGLRLREGIVRDQVKPVRDVALQVKHEGVVAGAVVRPEHRGRKRVRAIGMISFFVGVVRARGPICVERVLHTGSRVQGIRCLVIGIDQRGRRVWPSIHRLKRGSPAILREVVIEEPEARPDHCPTAVARRIGKSHARPELLAVVLGRLLRKSKRRQQGE